MAAPDSHPVSYPASVQSSVDSDLTPGQRHRAGLEAKGKPVCLLAYMRRCRGRLQAHHVIPKQTIRNAKMRASILAQSNRIFDAATQRIHETEMNELYADSRNACWLCEIDHLHEGEIDRDFLPPEVEDFASDYGLTWYLDQHYGRGNDEPDAEDRFDRLSDEARLQERLR